MNNQISLTIVVPALNEEGNLKDVVARVITMLHDNNIDGEIILVNDGSNDRTGNIANELASKDPRLKVLHHERPMGVGYSFREGLELSGKDAITWLPGDGENDPQEIFKYLPLLEHVDIVVPFVINTGVRSWGRRILSAFYLWIINLSFGTTFNYTNGNVIYRRQVFQVVKPESNGFFFQTECLIKAIRAGFIYAEVPVRLKKRLQGCPKALTFKSFYTVVLEFMRLFFKILLGKVARVPKHLQPYE